MFVGEDTEEDLAEDSAPKKKSKFDKHFGAVVNSF